MGKYATIKQLEITAINDCCITILESGTMGRIGLLSLSTVQSLPHSGIRGNETTKTMASIMALGPEPFLPIYYSVVKRKNELWLNGSIDTNQRASNSGNQTKISIGSLSDINTKQLTLPCTPGSGQTFFYFGREFNIFLLQLTTCASKQLPKI